MDIIDPRNGTSCGTRVEAEIARDDFSKMRRRVEITTESRGIKKALLETDRPSIGCVEKAMRRSQNGAFSAVNGS